jgi:serine O-acetyltransferase
MRRALADLRQDIARYRTLDTESPGLLLLVQNQGIWALACYRFSHAVHARRQGGPGSRAVALLWQTLVETATGISINPHAEIGRGFYIGHFSGIFIGQEVRIGEQCAISQGVTIGAGIRSGVEGSPVLGDGVYVAPGAKVFGPITIGAGAAIGANAVVRDDVPPGALAGGVPARILRS